MSAPLATLADGSLRYTPTALSFPVTCMGIYDRDYQQHDYGQQPGVQLRAPESVTVRLVVITAIVYVVQLIFREPRGLSNFDAVFSLHPDWYMRPWTVYQLLTYGFLHTTADMLHLLGNMFVLWMFGRYVEQHYGKKEFLSLYLTAIVFAGLVWSLGEAILPTGNPVPVLGASGGVSAVLLLFIFLYPNVTLLFMFVIPMKAWVLGVIIVGMDVFGAIGRHGNIAFMAHLGGFLFAWVYYKSGWRITDWLPSKLSLPKIKRRPPLKVHHPSDDEDDPLEDEVDRILKKIQEHGQDSLTARERRTLESASRTYQKKRK